MDPVLFKIGEVRVWYYGLAYAIGFLSTHLWVLRRRGNLDWSRADVYDFSLVFILSVLFFGRAFDIAVYEWDYNREHSFHLLSYWRGGMATHGVLLGAVVGAGLFCWIRKKNFLALTDEIVIPGALLMALGRIGNHINGEVCGYITNVSWAVKFPYAPGHRHPVALYEFAKNLAIIPILLYVRRTPERPTGLLLGHFIFWYGFLRLFSDYFRDYDSYWLGIGRGQYFNLLMALCGLGIIWILTKFVQQEGMALDASDRQARDRAEVSLWVKGALFYGLVLFCLTIPSGWTQDVLEVLRSRNSP